MSAETRKRIVISPESFKGSLRACDVALAIKRGVDNACLGFETVCLPVSDGGEGTLDSIIEKNSFKIVTVTGPEKKKVNARYGILGDTAVIEMAEAAGLELTANSRRAATATTYGVGELIASALDDGFRKITITAGGSATNDGGCGMASALGIRFIDEAGHDFIPVGSSLRKIRNIDISGMDKRLLSCSITVATDITNPMIGMSGATAVYAPQKGILPGDIDIMEEGMVCLAGHLEYMCGKKISDIPGTGAAGGLAAPLIAFAGASITSGIDMVLDAVGFDQYLSGDTVCVITGEGRIDSQSFSGKALSGIVRRSCASGIPVYCICGSFIGDRYKMKSSGISEIKAITDISPDLESAIRNAAEYIEKLAMDLALDIRPESFF